MSDGNFNNTKTNYVTSVYLSLRSQNWYLIVTKTSDPFPFSRSRFLFVHQEMFEKTASITPLGPLDFLAASLAERKIFLDMKLARRYYELTFLRFLVSCSSEFSFKFDGVILHGSVDGATLAVINKKTKIV